MRRPLLASAACAAGLLALSCAGAVPAGEGADRAGAPARGGEGRVEVVVAGPPVIEVREGVVWLGGARMDSLPPGKVEKARDLFSALWPRVALMPAEDERSYSLRVGSEVDGGQLKSVVATASAAGWTTARFGEGGSAVFVQHAGYPPAHAKADVVGAEWPADMLTLVVHAGAVEAWRVLRSSPPADAEGERPARARKLATLMGGDVSEEALRLLREECAGEEKTPCLPAALFVADDAGAGAVAKLGGALAVVAKEQGQAPTLVLHNDNPVDGEPPPNGRDEPAAARGHLEVPVIQKVVRASFGAFRVCYEAGLRRNRELWGKVVVRFVIGRDGKVEKAGMDEWRTSMPDADVNTCVLAEVRKLQFPSPGDGILTVVYPILFSPGG